MKEILSRQAGFTLVELIITVVVLLILVSVFIPVFNGVVTDAKTAKTREQMAAIRNAMIQYRRDVGAIPNELSDLVRRDEADNDGSGPDHATDEYDTLEGPGSGWNGPYISAKTRQDAWGVTIVLETTASGDKILRSGGANRNRGDEDDVTAVVNV